MMKAVELGLLLKLLISFRSVTVGVLCVLDVKYTLIPINLIPLKLPVNIVYPQIIRLCCYEVEKNNQKVRQNGIV